MMRYQILSFACAFSSIFFSLVSASCYYPDGSFPTDYVYVPCAGTEHTSCCIMSEGDQCLSNGLCYYPGQEYMFRGACTDKNWNSPNCFNHCTNKTNSYADSYDQIVKCGNDRYCCYSDGSTCCNDDSKVFTFGNLSVIKDLATTTRRTGGYQATAAATGTSQLGTSSTSRPSATSAETKAQATGTFSTTRSAASTPTSTSSESSSSTSSTSHTFSKTAIIAVSAGAIVLFIIAIALFWFFIRRHYRRQLSPSKEQGFPMSSDGFHRLSDKSPRPVEVPAPLHAPPPLYQPPSYQSPPPAVHGAVEIDSLHGPPTRNQWGQPVFEAPAQPYRHV